MYWIISDTHFGHDGLVRKQVRPAEFERMLETQLRRCLHPDDTLIHLGDVATTPAGYDRWQALAEQLCSRRLLIRGNHDQKSLAYYSDTGWSCVSDGLILDIFGKRVLFTHEPVDQIDPCDINIHGHLHQGNHRGDVSTDGRHILISVEHLHYRPILLRTVIELGATPIYRDGRMCALRSPELGPGVGGS